MYTFIYCMKHDDGAIITGRHNYMPDGYVIRHANNCESCDWYTMGVIDDKFNIVERLRVNYERYFGGFTFGHYVNTLTDEVGNPLENERLDTWIIERHANAKKKEFMEKPTLTVKPILVNDATGEEIPFFDETGTPVFYTVRDILRKHLKNEDIYIYVDDTKPEWWFTIAGTSANEVASAVEANYIAIIEQIYEVNTLRYNHWPLSHIKFEIIV
jgi:hypothetical protein